MLQFDAQFFAFCGLLAALRLLLATEPSSEVLHVMSLAAAVLKCNYVHDVAYIEEEAHLLSALMEGHLAAANSHLYPSMICTGPLACVPSLLIGQQHFVQYKLGTIRVP